MRYVILAICLGLSGPALSETCPAAPDIDAELDALYRDMQTAQNEVEARDYSNALWRYWTMAPDSDAQLMLDDAMRERAQFNLVGALRNLNALVDYCPHYAEGWNQRAFARFPGGGNMPMRCPISTARWSCARVTLAR